MFIHTEDGIKVEILHNPHAFTTSGGFSWRIWDEDGEGFQASPGEFYFPEMCLWSMRLRLEHIRLNRLHYI